MPSDDDATSQALATGVIVAIVISSIIGLGISVCVGITIYCLFCRTRTLYPGAVIHPQQQYQGTIIQSQQYAGVVMYPQQYPGNVIQMPDMQKIDLGHQATQ